MAYRKMCRLWQLVWQLSLAGDHWMTKSSRNVCFSLYTMHLLFFSSNVSVVITLHCPLPMFILFCQNNYSYRNLSRVFVCTVYLPFLKCQSHWLLRWIIHCMTYPTPYVTPPIKGPFKEINWTELDSCRAASFTCFQSWEGASKCRKRKHALFCLYSGARVFTLLFHDKIQIIDHVQFWPLAKSKNAAHGQAWSARQTLQHRHTFQYPMYRATRWKDWISATLSCGMSIRQGGLQRSWSSMKVCACR